MPVSKKPRKKGRRGHEIDARKKLIRGKFKTLDEAKKAIDTVEKARIKRRRQCEQIGWMLTFTSKETLLEAFTISLYAVERWPTTSDFDDFNIVSSSLMLGALCHKAMNIVEQDLLRDIQHAAYMTVVCARLRNHREPIPQANIEPIVNGLLISQKLMEYAYENDRQILIDVLKHNSRQNVEDTPGLLEKHERFILGPHYETVRQWELEDDELLAEIEKSKRLPAVDR